MANKHMTEDEKVLHGMGYAQELHRGMGQFQNFAISFSIICILSGGFGSFPIALSTGGTFSLTVGWLVGGAYALVVAAARRARVPITTPSSTSQSPATDPSGRTTSSSGPASEVMALVKTTGSSGGAMPDSRAWSW